MVQDLQVKCPHCQAVLSVKNSRNETFKEFECPSCHSSLRVKFPAAPPSQEEGRTIIGGKRQQLDPDRTCINRSDKGARYFLDCNGRAYELKEGLNTIGRKASMSHATIQIATDSMRMSRNHSRIELKRLSDGSMKIYISNWQNRNPTYVNGIELKPGDIMNLQEGYELKMGDNILRIKKV